MCKQCSTFFMRHLTRAFASLDSEIMGRGRKHHQLGKEVVYILVMKLNIRIYLKTFFVRFRKIIWHLLSLVKLSLVYSKCYGELDTTWKIHQCKYEIQQGWGPLGSYYRVHEKTYLSSSSHILRVNVSKYVWLTR